MMYDPSDLPCALCSSEPQEAGQEPAGAHVGAKMAPDIQKRLLALCEALSAELVTTKQTDGVQAAVYEARAIMEAMKPVEMDEERVQRIWQDWIDGKSNTGSVKSVIALALAEGRQLEREGK